MPLHHDLHMKTQEKYTVPGGGEEIAAGTRVEILATRHHATDEEKVALVRRGPYAMAFQIPFRLLEPV